MSSSMTFAHGYLLLETVGGDGYSTWEFIANNHIDQFSMLVSQLEEWIRKGGIIFQSIDMKTTNGEIH
jgi:hypothetical protein